MPTPPVPTPLTCTLKLAICRKDCHPRLSFSVHVIISVIVEVIGKSTIQDIFQQHCLTKKIIFSAISPMWAPLINSHLVQVSPSIPFLFPSHVGNASRNTTM